MALTFAHEGLVELFRPRPAFAAEFLAATLKLEVPAFSSAEVVDSIATQIVPVERRADLVVVFRGGPDETPVLVLVVEVQRSDDPEKWAAWRVYEANLSARHGCPARVVVVATNEPTARWASRPHPIGLGATWSPVVVGPREVPRVTEPADAVRFPELGVLSAVAHGPGPDGLRVALAATAGLAGLDPTHRWMYNDLILASLNEAARQEYEAMASSGTYELQSWFAKRYESIGLEKGREEGREEGREDGRAEEAVRLLSRQLTLKFGPLSPSVLERVQAATLPELETWSERILTAASLDAVFTG